ncbi:MAG TPA: hypothetical protein VF411_11090, partial [Bacteroidia bacterium]
VEEAKKYLSDVKKEDMNAKNIIGICLTATRGLYLFRTGFHDIGRQLYLEAMKMSKEVGDVNLNSLALINYLREEILVGSEDISETIPNLDKIIKHNEGEDIAEQAKEVLKLYNESKLRGEEAKSEIESK